ncbi:hypothetical protein PybrP1_012566 [[Pythium] brassicae (nom. inval.)]|nr:hypothetical protein PybrP1_012566 [[Pythium] brassicae (nom. inval.)]
MTTSGLFMNGGATFSSHNSRISDFATKRAQTQSRTRAEMDRHRRRSRSSSVDSLGRHRRPREAERRPRRRSPSRSRSRSRSHSPAHRRSHRRSRSRDRARRRRSASRSSSRPRRDAYVPDRLHTYCFVYALVRESANRLAFWWSSGRSAERRRSDERVRDRDAGGASRSASDVTTVAAAADEVDEPPAETNALAHLTEEEQMQALMGFGGFDSTKGKPVEDNAKGVAAGAVGKEKKRQYRQYMNRRGGFNRPLENTK